MLLMALAFWMYAIAVALARVRSIILEREAHTEWVRACRWHELASREFFAMGGYAALRVGQRRRLRRGDGRSSLAAAAPAPPARRRCAACSRQATRATGSSSGVTHESRAASAAAIIVGGVAVVGVAAALVLNALNSNLAFFFTPTAGERRRGAAGPRLPHRRHGQGRQRCSATS